MIFTPEELQHMLDGHLDDIAELEYCLDEEKITFTLTLPAVDLSAIETALISKIFDPNCKMHPQMKRALEAIERQKKAQQNADRH